MNGNALLDAALDYAAKGWRVLPCEPGGKRPLVRFVPHGHLDASPNGAKIRSWWSACPTANVAVVAGPESFDVLDVDGDVGERSLAALEAIHGPLPVTREHKTPNGRHILFQPGGLGCSVGVIGPGLDTKGGGGGYVLVPPSVVNGRAYVITRESA